MNIHTQRGRWRAWRFLILRRATQVSVLMLFLLGPLAGIWIVRGNLASSIVLDTLPLSDPFIISQSLLAGHLPATDALFGAALVAAFYLLFGGRVFCSWICPVNPVTDAAHWLRERLGLKGGMKMHRNARYWLLAASLLVAAVTGTLAWEFVNPVSALQRGIIFGLGSGLFLVLAVFVFDLTIRSRGWCGHLCPMGAFYSLLGRKSLLRLRASNRQACNRCMDCFGVCPEPQVINPALFGERDGIGPVIVDGNCTNCGRCIDICSKNVFTFGTRFNQTVKMSSRQQEARR